jgi:hypothetical protein
LELSRGTMDNLYICEFGYGIFCILISKLQLPCDVSRASLANDSIGDVYRCVHKHRFQVTNPSRDLQLTLSSLSVMIYRTPLLVQHSHLSLIGHLDAVSSGTYVVDLVS